MTHKCQHLLRIINHISCWIDSKHLQQTTTPTTNNQHQLTNNQQPSTNNHPTTNNKQQKTTISQQPTTINQQLTTNKQQPRSNNQQTPNHKLCFACFALLCFAWLPCPPTALPPKRANTVPKKHVHKPQNPTMFCVFAPSGVKVHHKTVLKVFCC
jgi:hypothetical protein